MHLYLEHFHRINHQKYHQVNILIFEFQKFDVLAIYQLKFKYFDICLISSFFCSRRIKCSKEFMEQHFIQKKICKNICLRSKLLRSEIIESWVKNSNYSFLINFHQEVHFFFLRELFFIRSYKVSFANFI